MSAITASVGAGLVANRLRNKEIVPSSWKRPYAPLVEVIIPARDEERNIGPLLDTLCAQDYPTARLKITVVDDGSSDGTAGIVSRYAVSKDGLSLVRGGVLPTGWTGKNNAMWTGMLHSAHDADWLLFLDADTRHHPLMVASIVREAELIGADLFSLVINVSTQSFWERLLVPQVGELYSLLVGTMDRVNSGSGSAANGQCMLVRAALYRELGNLPEVVGNVAEDRALAAAFVARGRTVKLAYGRQLVSARVYSSLPEMWAGYSKTLFWATGHNVPRTLAVIFALSFYAFAPLVTYLQAALAVDGPGKQRLQRHALLQAVPLLLVRAGVCRLVGVPLYFTLFYPLSVAMGNVMLLDSLCRVKSGKGVAWKGRTYHT